MGKLLLLALIIAPLIHVVHTVKNNQEQKNVRMSPSQKQAYTTTFIGTALIVVALIILIIISIILVLDSHKTNPEAGFGVAMIMLPVIGILLWGLLHIYIQGLYLIPTVYKTKQRFSSIIHIISAIISLFFMTGVIFCIAFLSATLDRTMSPEEFDLTINHFNPLKHITSILYISPLVMLIGGILGIKDSKKTNDNRPS